MNNNKIIGALITLLIGSTAQAGIISTVNVDVITAPASVMKDQLVGNNAYLMAEKLNYTTTTFLNVDAILPGTYTGIPSPKPFFAGETVDSYYLHYDLETTNSTQTSGSVTFDAPILAIIGASHALPAFHNLLGVIGTSYWTFPDPGGIWDSAATDSIEWVGNTINFSFRISSNIDSIRILTEASLPSATVPEPGSLGLLILGLVGIWKRGIFNRNRKGVHF